MVCIRCQAELLDIASFCHICGKKQNYSVSHRRHLHRARAQGTITKLKGNRTAPYWARGPAVYEDGKVIRESFGCYKTHAAAAEALGKAMYAPKASIEKELTLEDIYNRFTSSHYFDQLSRSAQGSHRSAWKHLAPCSKTPVSTINRDTFQVPIDTLAAQGRKRETLAKVRNLCSLLCREAMGLNLMSVNFGQLVQLPKSDSASVPPFTNAQLKLLWNLADHNDTDAMTVIVMCYTGMRPSELLGVDISVHMHLDGEHWYIVTGSKTESGYNRLIPLPPIIRPMIEKLINGRTSGPLIMSPKGGHYRLDNWRPRCFNPLMKKLSIPNRVPYSCRHTYSDLQKRRNVNPEIMMIIMGHEDYATTVEHYHSTTTDDIERICGAVAGMECPQ